MHAMQYEITLPADYDMTIIRDRVAKAGPALDDRAGLGLKAYLMRRRGVDGSPVNQYAPFYLWNDEGALGYFVAGGGGFQNIVRDFGRPAIAHWVGLAARPGPDRAAPARSASRRIEPVPAGADPAAVVTDALAALDTEAARDGVHTTALGLDPRGWELLRFTLWSGPVPADEPGEHYEVLHLSDPELADVPVGRHW